MDSEKSLKTISEAVRSYNGAIARWKSGGYKGDIPPELLSSIADLYNHTQKFFERKFGE